MIPRTLVPVNVRPVDKDEVKKPPSRTTTYMDDRTVVGVWPAPGGSTADEPGDGDGSGSGEGPDGQEG